MITLLVIADGRREYLEQTIPSALAKLQGPITRRIIYDDTGDALEREWLREAFPSFVIAHHPDGRQGFGGALRFMWAHLARFETNPFTFHLEQDFTFNRDVDLTAMVDVLCERPALIQMALRRQPWNDEERAAGGIVEQRPDTYVDCHDGQNDWLEHTNFFTTNPCLYRTELCRIGWPEDPHSEGKLGALIRDRTTLARFGFWGARDSGEWVTHVGRERVGTGY